MMDFPEKIGKVQSFLRRSFAPHSSTLEGAGDITPNNL
jgi:hypothetical protein